MKNITLSLDDETYHQARVTAAQRDQSVSAMVRELIKNLNHETNLDRALVQASMIASMPSFARVWDNEEDDIYNGYRKK